MVSATPWPLYPSSKEPWWPLYRWLLSHSSSLDGCGKEKLFLLPPVFAPRKILPVASHYTKYAMPVSIITVVDYSVGAGILFPGVRQPECDITHLSPVPAIRANGTLPPLCNVFMAHRQLFSVTDSIECNF